jgi:hypothetical protein
VAVRVDVEIRGKLVHQSGEVLEFSIEASAAGGGLGAVGQPFDDVGMFVEKLRVKLDAAIRIYTRFANLFDLSLGQRLPLFDLRWQGRGKYQAGQD